MNTLGVCLAGFGYWGPNLARNIVASDRFHLAVVLEPDKKKHLKISQLYPWVKIIVSVDDLMHIKGEFQVAAIATPTSSHFQLGKIFLDLDCHIWIEKPFTKNLQEAESLLMIAAEKNLKIFLDHTYLYSSAVSEIKSIVSTIGEITYINSTRANFGIIQDDASVIWDLAVHDLSIIDYLVDQDPIGIIATAASPFIGIQKSISTLILSYEKFSCTIHVNWLSPFKVRDFIIGGTSKSIYFDDTKTEDKVRIYSQSIEDLPRYSKHDIRLYDYKYGEILVPDISNVEALEEAFRQFALYIEFGVEPPSSGGRALRIIKILTAAEESIDKNGDSVRFGSLNEKRLYE